MNKKVLVLLLVFLISRLIFIEADPSQGIDFSQGNFTDEGFKTDQARANYYGFGERIFLGDYCTDCEQPNQHSTNNFIVNGLYQATFLLFGPGFFGIRITAVILSFLTLITFFLLLKHFFLEKFATLALALLVFNFVFFSFNRLALLENFMLFFGMISFTLLCIGVERKDTTLMMFSFLSSLIALVCKLSSNAAGSILFSNIPNSLLMLVRDYAILITNRAFRHSPVLYTTGMIAALLFLLKKIKFKTASREATSWLFFIWLALGMLFFGFFTYQPSRYLYLIFPPLAFFSTLFIVKFYRRNRILPIILLALLMFQSLFFFTYFSELSFSQINTSREFTSIAEQNNIKAVGGTWCPILAIESNILCQRGVIGMPYQENMLIYLNVDALAISKGEWEQFSSEYSAYKKVSFSQLTTFNIGKNEIYLIKVNRGELK